MKMIIQAETDSRPSSWGGLELDRLAAFAASYFRQAAGPTEFEVRPLRGGLESPGVFRVQAHFKDHRPKPRTGSFVVKRVSGRDSVSFRPMKHSWPGRPPP
jgi:hypothetical protein